MHQCTCAHCQNEYIYVYVYGICRSQTISCNIIFLSGLWIIHLCFDSDGCFEVFKSKFIDTKWCIYGSMWKLFLGKRKIIQFDSIWCLALLCTSFTIVQSFSLHVARVHTFCSISFPSLHGSYVQQCSFISDNKWLLSTFSFPHYLYGWFSIAIHFCLAWYHFQMAQRNIHFSDSIRQFWYVPFWEWFHSGVRVQLHAIQLWFTKWII